MKNERSAGPAIFGQGFRTGCGGFATIIVGKKRVKAENAATAILHFQPLLRAAEKYDKALYHYLACTPPYDKRFGALCAARDALNAEIESSRSAT